MSTDSKKNVKSLLVWTSLIITYLFVEWVYNQHLLQILSLDNINSTAFERTELFGKLIASFGINLFLIKVFKYSKKTFLIGFTIGYLLLTIVFYYAIDNFSDEFRHSSYYSMLYREDVIKGEDSTKLLSHESPILWHEKSVLLSYFIFTMNGEDWRKYETQVKNPVYKKIKKLEKDLPQIWKTYQNVNQLKAQLEKGYSKYQDGVAVYSRFSNSYNKNQIYKSFLRKSGGLPPNLNQIQFYERVKGGKEYLKFREQIICEEIKEANIPALLGKDIPLGMKQQEFKEYVINEINTRGMQIAPNIKNIRSNVNSQNPVAILIIPPISIALSLISILLNSILLIGSWIILIPQCAKNTKKTIGIYLTIVSTLLIIVWVVNNPNKILNEKWGEMEAVAAEQYPVLSKFWQFTFRFEPLLSPKKPNEGVVKFTELLYGEGAPVK